MEIKFNFRNNTSDDNRDINSKTILEFLKPQNIGSYVSRKLHAWEIPPFKYGIPISRTAKKRNIIKTKVITVLKTSNQEATLSAIYKENSQAEDLVFTYKLTGLNATEWKLSYNEIATIYAERKVSVKDQSKFNNLGEFTIGKYTNWLYNVNLWEKPNLLEDAIYDLLNFSLTGIDFSS